MKVQFYESVEDRLLKFAVIISKADGKWVFCKHKERNTYEVPGGHREDDETILETANCVYSVTGKNRVELFEELPDDWTYPLIQPLLIKEYERVCI